MNTQIETPFSKSQIDLLNRAKSKRKEYLNVIANKEEIASKHKQTQLDMASYLANMFGSYLGLSTTESNEQITSMNSIELKFCSDKEIRYNPFASHPSIDDVMERFSFFLIVTNKITGKFLTQYIEIYYDNASNKFMIEYEFSATDHIANQSPELYYIFHSLRSMLSELMIVINITQAKKDIPVAHYKTATLLNLIKPKCIAFFKKLSKQVDAHIRNNRAINLVADALKHLHKLLINKVKLLALDNLDTGCIFWYNGAQHIVKRYKKNGRSMTAVKMSDLVAFNSDYTGITKQIIFECNKSQTIRISDLFDSYFDLPFKLYDIS